MKYCNNCEEKLKSNSNFCPKCGARISEELDEEIISKKSKTNIGNIIRYIIGLYFLLGGLVITVQGRFYGFIYMALGISLFPFLYSKINNNTLKKIQIIMPIIMVALLLIFVSDISNDYNNDISDNSYNNIVDDESRAVSAVKRNLFPAYQSIRSYSKNSDNTRYDFIIKESDSDLTPYRCAVDLYNLANKVVGTKLIGNVEFECASNNETIYYVSINEISELSIDDVEKNINYYDSNHNNVKTSINTLKASVINDYKKDCKSYSYKDVLRNPENYEGKRAYWFGEINQVVDKSNSRSTFKIAVNCERNSFSSSGYVCDDDIYVIYNGSESFIEDDMVKMWGTMDGTKTYTTVLGASLTIPKFNAEYMDLQ